MRFVYRVLSRAHELRRSPVFICVHLWIRKRSKRKRAATGIAARLLVCSENYGMTALTWAEKSLSTLLESTEVTT
jgi:hypothetical protein